MCKALAKAARNDPGLIATMLIQAICIQLNGVVI